MPPGSRRTTVDVPRASPTYKARGVALPLPVLRKSVTQMPSLLQAGGETRRRVEPGCGARPRHPGGSRPRARRPARGPPRHGRGFNREDIDHRRSARRCTSDTKTGPRPRQAVLGQAGIQVVGTPLVSSKRGAFLRDVRCTASAAGARRPTSSTAPSRRRRRPERPAFDTR